MVDVFSCAGFRNKQDIYSFDINYNYVVVKNWPMNFWQPKNNDANELYILTILQCVIELISHSVCTEFMKYRLKLLTYLVSCTNLSRNLWYIPLCTNSRLVHRQISPWFRKADLMILIVNYIIIIYSVRDRFVMKS